MRGFVGRRVYKIPTRWTGRSGCLPCGFSLHGGDGFEHHKRERENRMQKVCAAPGCKRRLRSARQTTCTAACRQRLSRHRRRVAPDEFTKRGISPEIRHGRPYERFWKDDPSPVQRAHATLDEHGRSFITRLAGQQHGWLIPRYPPPGLDLDPIYPEIKWDAPVETGPPVWHAHPDHSPRAPLVHPLKGKISPKTGKPYSGKYELRPVEQMGKHIQRGSGPDGKKSPDDHAGVNRQDVHCHRNFAKYTFPPSPRIPAMRKRADGTLEPILRKNGKPLTVKDRSVNYAKRIDMHPGVAPRFETAERGFFGNEGCLKADAIASQGEAAISVPSVTLWDPPELEAVAARYLRHLQAVYIVQDADWHTNPLVLTQGFLLRTRLRGLGVNAHIAAPPHKEWVEEHGYALGYHKGVDDFLGAGGSLDELLVIDREVPAGLALWVAQRMPGVSKQRILRDSYYLGQLILHAGEDGRFCSSLASLARVLDTTPTGPPGDPGVVRHERTGPAPAIGERRAQRAAQSLVAIGALSYDTSLDIEELVWRGRYFDRYPQWKDRPVLTVHEDLRAKTTFRPLADAEPATKRDIARLESKLDDLLRMGGLFPNDREFEEYVTGLLNHA